MKKTALIMAGGAGERFWPKSRKNMPKQFLNLIDDEKSMLQLTVDRMRHLMDIEDIFIATNVEYKDIVKNQICDLPIENIICEPCKKDTLPCIGLGAMHIQKKYDDALMIVLASDHLIKNTSLYIDTLKDACEVAEQGQNLVTIGIVPDYPETGYGYIKFDKNTKLGKSYKVECFTEKPSYEIAKEYVASEEYLWNSGEFVWKCSTILDGIKTYESDTYNHLLFIQSKIGTQEYEKELLENFAKCNAISIDFGIMEKAKDIYILNGAYGWDDVGSWLSVDRLQKHDENGNAFKGKVIAIDNRNVLIQGGDRLIATVGLEDIIIVDTYDALLVCDKNSVSDIKKIVSIIKHDRNKLEE